MLLNAPRSLRPLWRASLATCVAFAVVLCTPLDVAATEGTPTPLEVRAAFLLNLARFVRWPEAGLAEPGRAFVIGYFAGDPIAVPLRQIVQDESIANHPIQLLELRHRTDFNRCNLVYVGDNFGGELARAIENRRDRPVLFVGNSEALLAVGGHVQFYQRGSQVRLRISPENLRTSGLIPNSQLLRVATMR